MKKYIIIDQDSEEAPLRKQVLQPNSIKILNYCEEKENYYSIEKNLLLLGSEIAFSLFSRTEFDFKPILKASESSPVKLTPEILLNTEADVTIKVTDLPLYNEYIKSFDNKLSTLQGDDKIIASSIKEKTKIVVKNILSNPKSGQNIREAAGAVEHIINSILSNNNILHELISIKNYDYYTYTHCVNVAVLSIGLGMAVNLSEGEIFDLGLGALLHDIGKTAIPSKILNKPGRLTSAEYRIMKSHVMEGVRILEGQTSLSKESLSVVAQHHERLSGKGYPQHLLGANITKYAKIVAITDTYDCLTTERPTKEPLIPFEALSIIVNDCEHYDSEYLSFFIKMLGRLQD